jgi:hypothetical protein
MNILLTGVTVALCLIVFGGGLYIAALAMANDNLFMAVVGLFDACAISLLLMWFLEERATQQRLQAYEEGRLL